MLIKTIILLFIAIFSAPMVVCATEPIDTAMILRQINELKTEISTLKHDNATLRKELNQLKDDDAGSAGAFESDILAELDREISAAATMTKEEAPPAKTSFGAGGAMNPDIGLSGIITVTAGTKPEQGGRENSRTAEFEEAELIISGHVDPYHKYDLVLGFHDDEAEVEEAYLTFLNLPLNLTGRIGLFRSALGFYNQHHIDELPWAGSNFLHEAYFGDGLTTEGVELKRVFKTSGAWTPTLSFEASTGNDYDAVAGTGEPTKFNPFLDRSQMRDHRYLARLRNSFDIGKNSDLTLGLNYFSADLNQLEITGVDFQYRNFPTGYQGLTLSGEYFERNDKAFKRDRRAASLSTKNHNGYMLAGQYQFDSNWRAGASFAEFDSIDMLAADQHRSSALWLAFYKTEFSRYLLQYEKREGLARETDNRLTLQFVFSTGYHRHALK